MKAEKVKVELENLEAHMGNFRDRKFKMKGEVTYEELMLTIDDGKTVVRLHARNINNVHLEKKAIRIAAMNFEIRRDDDVSVVSGAIKLELKDESEAWYKALWS
ncbi:MAG: hypothetical protein GF411_11115 [Candidatus Lokiarchaeota archaeon]|nr:hypothetical protein [Candidatus Lokiarchaeota archaeon]